MVNIIIILIQFPMAKTWEILHNIHNLDLSRIISGFYINNIINLLKY